MPKRMQSADVSIVLSATVITILAGVACTCGPSLTAGQRRGKQIYESLRDKCHKLIDPKSLSDEQWMAAADKYSVKLNLRSDEIAELKDYLTHAHDAP